MSDAVSKQSSAMAAMSKPWPMIAALLGGTQAMREAGKLYLPKWPNEDEDSYKLRKDMATLFPAYSRTVDVLSAKPFSRPLTIGDDVPERLKSWAEDIDLQGRNLHAFTADVLEEALGFGLSGIMVEYPRVGQIVTQAEEQAVGARPYFIHIKCTQILGWRAERVAGRWSFTQLRIMECVSEPDGDFGDKRIEQVRVLTPGAWQVWRKSEANRGDWTLHESGTTTLRKVPFVPVYGQREGFMEARPPLLDLAYLNVEHWQSKSDQQNILHVARVPILFGAGLSDDTTITVGASSAIKTSAPDASLKFVEHSGQAIGAGRQSLLDLEDAMRQTGAELLVIKPGNTSTAQTAADNEPGKCALQRIAEDVEDAVDAALQLAAEWIGEASGGHVELFKDFGAASLGEASAEFLLSMNQAGKLSNQTLFDEVKRRGILSPELVWDDEAERITADPPPLGTA